MLFSKGFTKNLTFFQIAKSKTIWFLETSFRLESEYVGINKVGKFWGATGGPGARAWFQYYIYTFRQNFGPRDLLNNPGNKEKNFQTQNVLSLDNLRREIMGVGACVGGYNILGGIRVIRVNIRVIMLIRVTIRVIRVFIRAIRVIRHSQNHH